MRYKEERHSLSALYLKLHTAAAPSSNLQPFTGLESDFSDNDLSQKILEGWGHVRKVITNEKWREMQFRLIHRTLYGFIIPPHPNVPDRKTACPMCLQAKTNLTHSIWSCAFMQDFWRQVVTLLRDTLHIDLPLEPLALLFHYFSTPVRNCQLAPKVLSVN